MNILPPSTASAFSNGQAWKPIALVAGLLLGALPSIPSAHLSIIRQGRESAGIPDTGDRFGQVLTAGDFNGDGYEDLATAATRDDTTSVGTANGSVVINWGSEFGLTHENAQFLPSGTVISHSSSAFGSALANGDFNQDGFDDLVVGIPLANIGSFTRNGMVAIYYGGVNGVSQTPFVYNQALLGHSFGDNAFFGHSLAVGDLDDDGNPDLVIGSPGYDVSRGAVYWMFGTGNGVTTAGADWATQTTFGMPASNGDQFGFSVAVGQLDGFLIPGGSNPVDIAVGIPNKDGGGGNNTGAIAVFLSSGGSGPNPTVADFYTPSSLGLSLPANTNSYFGFSLAAADVVPSSHDELVVGRPGFDTSKGEVILLQGGTNSLSLIDSYDANDFGLTPAGSDLFGYDVDCGDWDDDGIPDVAVGSPGNTPAFTTLSNAGRVFLYLGSATGMVNEDHWGQPDLGETTKSNFQLGLTVRFGRFDDSDRANIAAGAPGTVSAGQVHVIAPWRQVMGLHCKNSVALDCQDDMVFSQKPFDPVFLASTTKTMTILIACERTQLPTTHPDYVSPNAMYTVPAWVANNIGGSQFDLVTGEQMSLFNLMAMTMAVSGNDCAYAIGDMLTGGGATFVDIFNVVPDFIAEMDARAKAIGMFDTNFLNPAGLSGDEPESTAYDMALLSRVAMDNSLFASIVGTAQWQIVRNMPAGGGGFFSQTETINHFFVPPLQSRLPEATGVKGGSTNPAQSTGVYAARHSVTPWGSAIASSFHTPFGDGIVLLDEGAALLRLGLEECGITFDYAPAPSTEIGPLVEPGISADINKEWITKAPPPDLAGPITKLEVYSELAPGVSTNVLMEVTRLSEVTLQHNSAVDYFVSNVTGHKGIIIINGTEAAQITLSVTTNIPGVPPLFVQVKKDDALVIPPAALPAAGDFILTLTALVGIGNEAMLTLTENYEETVNVGSGGAAPSVYSMDFTRPGFHVTEHMTTTKISGLDTTPGRTVGLVVRGDDPGYVYEPNLAQMNEYGAGWPGTAGVPILKSYDLPVLGGSFDLLMGNSLLADTAALWNIGFNPLSFQTTLGGTVLVQKFVTVPVMLPAAGLEFTLGVPADPSFIGVSFFHQLYIGDPGASDGIAFSRGLEMKVGL